VLTVQCKGDLIRVLLDGDPVITYYTQAGSPMGTRHGLYRKCREVTTAASFDTWLAKAL
jgi:hypothetical protein